MAEEKDFLQRLAGEVVDFFEFVASAFSDKTYRDALILDLGGRPGKPGEAPQPFPEGALKPVKEYRDATDPSAEAGLQVLADIAMILDALSENLEAWFHDGQIDLQAGDDQRLHSLIELLTSNFVRLNYPRLFLWLQVVALIEDIGSTYGDGNDGSLVRVGTSFWALLSILFQPGEVMRKLDPGTGGQAERDRTGFFVDAAVQAGAISVAALDRDEENDIKAVADVLTGWDHPPGTPTQADIISQRMSSIALGDENGDERLVLSTAMVPKSEGGTALFLGLGGGFGLERQLSPRWRLSVKAAAGAGVAILVPPFRATGPGRDNFKLEVELESHPTAATAADPSPGEVSFSFPSPRGTRLDIGKLGVALKLAPDRAELLLSLTDGAFFLDPDSFDGFIKELLSTPLRLPFNLVLGPSSARGFVVEGNLSHPGTPAQPAHAGGAGAVTIPIGRAFGPVTLHELGLRVQRPPPDPAPGDPTAFKIEIDATFSATLGPVYLRVDQLGLEVVTDPGAARPNLGIVDLHLGAKFPRGIAINIESALVAGGGSILHDPAQGLYFGTFALAIRGGTVVKATALIGTRMPDGAKGFSLLVMVTVDFARPYPLGMGFFLESVGGMLALHRTFDEAAMRAALPTGQLRNVLFAADPVHRSAELLQAIQTLFPMRRGSYMLGALVKISWASPPLIRMELAVILEWGKQERLILLGRVSALLPRPDKALLRLNLDSVGILDFNAGTFALDAILYDSRLCDRFVLSGAMAMRMSFKGSAGFALAIGGLHPRFNAPAGFPSLARLQLALTTGQNPRLICQAYFAITSNTIQFGADCSLYASALGFSIEGNVGFDVLIQLVPFHFLAEFRASIQLKRGSRNLFKVSVKGELEGPLPLRIAGKASFEILWCDFTVSFNKTLVEGRSDEEAATIDALAVLTSALRAPRAWETALPPDAGHMVTLRPSSTEGILLHPLGTLTVRQTAVPLGLTVDIDRIGAAIPSGEARFAITRAVLGDPTSPSMVPRPVQEMFAPGQYFDMSDDERLAAPSFEPMTAGVTLADDSYGADLAAGARSKFEYTDIVIKDGIAVEQNKPHVPTDEFVRLMTLVSAAAFSQAGRTLEKRFEAPVRRDAPKVNRAGWNAVDLGAPGQEPLSIDRRNLSWVEMYRHGKDLPGRRVLVRSWELINQ